MKNNSISFLEKTISNLNSNQRLVAALIVPLVLFIITITIASNVGETHYSSSSHGVYHFGGDNNFNSFSTPLNKPEFDWANTWYIWLMFLLFVGYFEFKLFAPSDNQFSKLGGTNSISTGNESMENHYSGLTIEDAIKLPELSIEKGIAEIYRMLTRDYGFQNIDWRLLVQRTINKEGRRFDEMKIILKNGKEISIFFDKTEIGKEWKDLIERNDRNKFS